MQQNTRKKSLWKKSGLHTKIANESKERERNRNKKKLNEKNDNSNSNKNKTPIGNLHSEYSVILVL